MQALQEFEASIAGVEITDQGDALVTFLTDKGHIAVLMRRVVLERLFEQAKNELQRIPRSRRDNYCALWSLDELVGQTSKRGGIMAENSQRITSFAPQLLMDDLERAIKLYSDVLGFSFGPTWRGFYAIGERDGFSVHLKCAPKVVEDRANRRQHQHLDVYASVIGVSALYADCKAKGATILKPLDRTPWGTNDFYLEDPEGYIIAFGESDNPTPRKN